MKSVQRIIKKGDKLPSLPGILHLACLYQDFASNSTLQELQSCADKVLNCSKGSAGSVADLAALIQAVQPFLHLQS